jgi:hypothetical protein
LGRHRDHEDSVGLENPVHLPKKYGRISKIRLREGEGEVDEKIRLGFDQQVGHLGMITSSGSTVITRVGPTPTGVMAF